MSSTTTYPDIIEQIERTTGHRFRENHGEWVTNCFFHEDQHPSLSLNTEKGVYHCFGCGASGTTRQLLKELNIPFQSGYNDILPGKALAPSTPIKSLQKLGGDTEGDDRLISGSHVGRIADPSLYYKSESEFLEILRSIPPASADDYQLQLDRSWDLKSRPAEAGGITCRVTTSTTTSNYFEAVEEVAHLEWGVGEVLGDKAERLEGCGKKYTAYLCDDCHARPARVWYCGSSLCPECRERRLKVFFEKHQEDIPTGGLNIITLQMIPTKVEGPKEEQAQIRYGREVLAAIKDELELPWLIYFMQVRIWKGSSVPTFYVLFPGGRAVLDQVELLWVAAGFKTYREVKQNYPNGNVAIWRLIEWARLPVLFGDLEDLRLYLDVSKHLRTIESLGLRGKVSGGMMKVGGRKAEQVCPVCGGTHLRKLGLVDASQVRMVDGRCTWFPADAPELRVSRAEVQCPKS